LRKRHDLLAGRVTHRVRRRIGIIWRPLATGALTENAPQLQNDQYGNDRQQEYEGCVGHVSCFRGQPHLNGAVFGELEYFPTSLSCPPIQYIGESAFLFQV
jgi:hypothetical protein